MAYADQEMSGNKIAAFVVAALLHLALGYALVTGLAYEGFKQVLKKVTTVDIKKEEKKEEKPPPPKKEAAPPPIVVPPPKMNLSPPQTAVETTPTPAPPPPTYQLPTPAPPAPPPPPPKAAPKALTPKGNPANWVTNNDYPTRALRENRSGVTGFRLTVGADGRPTGCDITASSGSPDLDSTACSLLMRRAKFQPGQDSDGNPTGGVYSSRFRWVIPEE